MAQVLREGGVNALEGLEGPRHQDRVLTLGVEEDEVLALGALVARDDVPGVLDEAQPAAGLVAHARGGELVGGARVVARLEGDAAAEVAHRLDVGGGELLERGELGPGAVEVPVFEVLLEVLDAGLRLALQLRQRLVGRGVLLGERRAGACEQGGGEREAGPRERRHAPAPHLTSSS